MLMSCSRKERIVIRSDYCDLYPPLTTELSKPVKNHWEELKITIKTKLAEGKILTPNEELIKIFVEHAIKAEKIYDLKCEAND